MDLHPQAQAMVALIESLGEPPLTDQTPEQARASRRARLRPPAESIHEVRNVDAGGVPARLYRPNDTEGLGLLVFFHGGGWVIGDLDSHDNVCRALANRSGAAVLSVDYRLAPEHRWPAAVDDCTAATVWAAANAGSLGVDAGRLAVGGDSAGGNLAAIVAQERAVPLRFQLLVYPATDARRSSDAYASYVENVDGPVLSLEAMHWFYDHYLGHSGAGDAGPADDARVSPLLADDAAVAGLPTALVITASHDPLRDEGEAYARRLMGAGVPTTLTRYPGLFHGFFSMGDLMTVADAAVDEAADALARALR